MKTSIENWKELITETLNQEEMFRIRGGGGGEGENPEGPIIK